MVALLLSIPALASAASTEAGGAPALRFAIEPDTLRVRNLARTSSFVLSLDTLGSGGAIDIDLPWALTGLDPDAPPPPLGPDQVDLWIGTAPADPAPRIESRAGEKALRLRVVHKGPALSRRDTLRIVPRFVLTPSRPGPQAVGLSCTPLPGAAAWAGSATVEVLPAIALAALTTVAPGAALPVRVRAAGLSAVELELDGRRARLEGVGPLFRGSIVAPRRAGYYRIQASDPEHRATPARAVLKVTPNPAAERVWWTDLHGHSALSDGFGSPRRFYEYARDHALLDAAALTDHDHLLDDAEWDRVCALADSMEALPEFSAIPAYEWSSRFGDRNVYLPRRHVPIPRRGDPWGDHVRELQAWAGETGAVLVPHHPASGFRSVDWTLHSPAAEPVCEVYSIHGWAWSDTTRNPITPRTPALQRCATPRLAMAVPGRGYLAALALDPALGVIASGDIHSAQPGNLGLAALRAPELRRDELLRALRERRVYGTTGARILLELAARGPAVGVDGEGGGGALFGAATLHLRALAAGPGELAELTILRDGEPWMRSRRPGWPGVIEAADSPRTTTSYQVVARQTDGERAFSSPIVAHPPGPSAAASPESSLAAPPSGAVALVATGADLVEFSLDVPATVLLEISARCRFVGVPGPGPELADDDLWVELDGIPLSAPGLEPPALAGDRLRGTHLDGALGRAWWSGALDRGPHRVRLVSDGAPTDSRIVVSRLPGAAPRRPSAADPPPPRWRPLGPDLPPAPLYTLEDRFSITRHPLAADAGLLLITWSRDLSGTSAFGEESRWVELDLRLCGGRYALRPLGFEEGRDFVADDGRGGVRATVRADRPAALEVLYRGERVDAVVALRRGGRWDQGWWEAAGRRHQAPPPNAGLRLPLSGRPRALAQVALGDPASRPDAAPLLSAPVLRAFPDSSVFAALAPRFPRAPEIAARIDSLAAGRDALWLRQVATLFDGDEAASWWERAARAPGATALDWRQAAAARRRAGAAESALRLLAEAPAELAVELHDERGRILRALRRWAEAAEAFAAARLRQGMRTDLLVAEAECRRKAGDSSVARELVAAALEQRPDHARALREWVHLFAGHSPSEALRALDLLAESAADPWVHFQRALALNALGRDAAARSALARCLDNDPPAALAKRARRLGDDLREAEQP